MGAWGEKIYQDDIACDIKEEYLDLLREGASNEEATEKLLSSNKEFINDVDDGPIFWFALADTQWNYGKLLPHVKKEAIKAIDNESDLDRWKENDKLYSKRKKVLEQLKEKLNSEPPKEKKVKKHDNSYKCEWKIGDVFAYKLDNELIKAHEFYGKYLIIIKTDETIWYPKHIIPVVKFKITKNEIIPKTIEEINNLEYIQSFFAPLYDELFLNPELRNLPRDEYGFTPSYEIKIITTSKRVIPQKLIYIGNFNREIEKPKIEYISKDKIGISAIHWKELESKIIYFYEQFNKRKSDIYKPNFWEERKKVLEQQRFYIKNTFDENNIK